MPQRRTARAACIGVLVLLAACEHEQRPVPTPTVAPHASRPSIADRPPPSAFIGDTHESWSWSGEDGRAERCVEVRRTWQWDNDSNPLGSRWRPPEIEAPAPDGLDVLECELYLRRWDGSCTIDRPDVEDAWQAPPEVQAEERETRYYVGAAVARAGRAECESRGGMWSGRGRWERRR